MQAFKTSKSVNSLKNLLNTIFTDTYLEPYLRHLKTLS